MASPSGAQDLASRTKLLNEMRVLDFVGKDTKGYRKRGYEDIEPPLGLARHNAGGHVPCAVFRANTSSGTWSFLAAHGNFRPLWTFGFRPTDLSNFFESLPLDIRRLLQAIPKLAQPLPSNKQDDPKPTSPEVTLSDWRMWQSQSWCGFLQLFYDPETGERTDVAFNDLHARLFGMQREELIARFAAHDVPLPFAPHDLLILLIDTVANGYADGERYLRIFGLSGQPVLVCVATKRSYNHAAQLLAVRLDLE
jgi:hypothetical protein